MPRRNLEVGRFQRQKPGFAKGGQTTRVLFPDERDDFVDSPLPERLGARLPQRDHAPSMPGMFRQQIEGDLARIRVLTVETHLAYRLLVVENEEEQAAVAL